MGKVITEIHTIYEEILGSYGNMRYYDETYIDLVYVDKITRKYKKNQLRTELIFLATVIAARGSFFANTPFPLYQIDLMLMLLASYPYFALKQK